MSGPESKRHLLAEESTILKKLPVVLLLLHTPCALLRVRESRQLENMSNRKRPSHNDGQKPKEKSLVVTVSHLKCNITCTYTT